MSLTLKTSNLSIFRILTYFVVTVLIVIMTVSTSYAAPKDDACDGKAVSDACSYSGGTGRRTTGGDTIEGQCRRGPNGGLTCDGNNQWFTCSSDASAAGDPCRIGGTEAGICQRVTTGSGRSAREISECVATASTGAPANGTNGSTGAPANGTNGATGAPANGTSGGTTGGTANGGAQAQPQTVSFNNPINATSIPELIGTIIQGVLGLLGAIAVAIIIYAGFTYMTAGGNSSKTSQAITTITNAIIGLVVIMGAFLIVDYVISAILA